MADSDSKTYTKRMQLVDLARAQVGCHYVNGAAGNTPGNADGAWYRPDAVKLHPNKTDNKGDLGRKVPIYQSALCTISGKCVCGGRADNTAVKGYPKGDYDADIVIFDGYRWPRPDKYIDASHTIWGESCEGVRHFDCIGFVNWCLSEVVKKCHYGITNFEKHKYEPVDPKDPSAGKKVKSGLLKLSEIRAGDILLMGTHHIGIASEANSVIHASGYKRGVIESHFKNTVDKDGSDWDFVYRPSNSFWS